MKMKQPSEEKKTHEKIFLGTVKWVDFRSTAECQGK